MTAPDYESLVELVYTHVLEPDSWAIDVGAHHGRHTIPMALAAGPGGFVLAFEPLPQAREELKSRLAAERREGRNLARVEVRGEALGLTEAPARFLVVEEYPEYSGLRPRTYDVEVQTHEIEIETRRLDSFLPILSRIGFLKVDAEGGETHILQGGRGLLNRDRPIVCYEFGDNSNRHYGVTAHDLYDLWEEVDYQLLSILGDRLDRESFAQSSAAQFLWDYVAIPAERTEGLCRDLSQALRVRGSA